MPNWDAKFNATNAAMNVNDMIKNAQKGGFEPYEAQGVAKYASTIGGRRRRKRTRRRKSRRSRR